MLKKGSWKATNRTALGDISNGGRPSRDATKKIQLGRECDGGYLDRLLLVRSKLSALVNQIDEIFAQSSEQDMKSKISNEDIESLSNHLSEMHSALEPWVLRLGQSQTTTTTEVQVLKSRQKNYASTHRDRLQISPRIKDKEQEPTLDTIISPSPLVAWRAGGCKLVTEKQLFLLTPLSKLKNLSRNLNMKNTNDTCIVITNSDNLPETMVEFVEENGIGKTKLKNQSEAYQKKKSNMRRDADEEALEWFLSPPKTCTLMNPNHGSSNPSVVEEKSSNNRHPKIAGTIDFIDVLARRDDGNIPECFQARRKPDDSDEALEWFLSPPKTCIVMEPLREQKIPSPAAMVDGSMLRSQRAGENTLKKELWTKFQAVSMGRIFYRASVLQKGGKKGFMDMLEEAT